MAGLLTVRLLDRPGDLPLVLPRRAAWQLIRPRRDTSHICCVTDGDGYAVDLLDGASRLPAEAAQVWPLPQEQCRPARSPLASVA